MIPLPLHVRIHAISYTQWGVCLYLQHNSAYVATVKAYDSSKYISAFTSVDLALMSGDEVRADLRYFKMCVTTVIQPS